MTSLKKLLLGEQGLVVLFAVAFAIVAMTVPNFLTERNMLGLLQSVVTIGIVACTMMLCLASRDFDLSVGSTVAFSGMVAVMPVCRARPDPASRRPARQAALGRGRPANLTRAGETPCFRQSGY